MIDALVIGLWILIGLLLGWAEWGNRLHRVNAIDMPELYRWRASWEAHYGALAEYGQARLVLVNLKAHAEGSEFCLKWPPTSKGPWNTMGLRETLRQGEGITWGDLEPIVERQPMLLKDPDALQRYIKERGTISLVNILRWQAARR